MKKVVLQTSQPSEMLPRPKKHHQTRRPIHHHRTWTLLSPRCPQSLQMRSICRTTKSSAVSLRNWPLCRRRRTKRTRRLQLCRKTSRASSRHFITPKRIWRKQRASSKKRKPQFVSLRTNWLELADMIQWRRSEWTALVTASWYVSKLYSCMAYFCWLKSKRHKCCCIVNLTFILKHIHQDMSVPLQHECLAHPKVNPAANVSASSTTWNLPHVIASLQVCLFHLSFTSQFGAQDQFTASSAWPRPWRRRDCLMKRCPTMEERPGLWQHQTHSNAPRRMSTAWRTPSRYRPSSVPPAVVWTVWGVWTCSLMCNYLCLTLDLSPSSVNAWLRMNASENLPDTIRLSLPLPAGCRLGLVVRDMGDSTLQTRRAQSSQWAPPDDELLAGIEYINQNAPECDSQNQQYYWILCNIKEDAGSPISGWPEAKVRIMAQNKAKGMAGAQLETDFPLHTYSLKPFLAEKLLPLLYPLFMNFAFMFLGWPGVGKTPAIIIMMLAMGRYHASRLDLPTPPGWRRAKSLDNFRHRVGNIHEGVFLDDPSREKIDLADLKSFVTAEENQTCHGRYNDVKLAKNCCRAYAANDIQEEDEPKNEARLHRLCITMEEFLKLLRRTFPGDKPISVQCWKGQLSSSLANQPCTFVFLVRKMMLPFIVLRSKIFTRICWPNTTNYMVWQVQERRKWEAPWLWGWDCQRTKHALWQYEQVCGLCVAPGLCQRGKWQAVRPRPREAAVSCTGVATIFSWIRKPRETAAHLQGPIARHSAQQACQVPLPTKEKIALQGTWHPDLVAGNFVSASALRHGSLDCSCRRCRCRFIGHGSCSGPCWTGFQRRWRSGYIHGLLTCWIAKSWTVYRMIQMFHAFTQRYSLVCVCVCARL